MSAFMLRLIACIAMLSDHVGYYYGVELLRIIGRIAFPIFLYLIYNGYRHTSHRVGYALRLGIFALLSQIPFSLFCTNGIWMEKGNVFFTLLISLLVLWTTDTLWKHRFLRILSPVPTLAVFALYFFGFLRSDYGAKGILMIMVFYLFDSKKLWCRICTVVGVLIAVFYSKLVSLGFFFLYTVLGKDYCLPSFSNWELIQAYSLLALPLIFLYNGKKGGNFQNKNTAKAVQYGFYLFYPVHMLVLWGLRFL